MHSFDGIFLRFILVVIRKPSTSLKPKSVLIRNFRIILSEDGSSMLFQILTKQHSVNNVIKPYLILKHLSAKFSYCFNPFIWLAQRIHWECYWVNIAMKTLLSTSISWTKIKTLRGYCVLRQSISQMKDQHFLRRSFQWKYHFEMAYHPRLVHRPVYNLRAIVNNHSKTENRLFKKYILSAVTSKSSFLNGDYLGALQIFQITKLSNSDDPTDGDFWCPMFQDIVHTKLGF